MRHDTIEPISFQTLEDIGDAAFNAIKDTLKEKGYSSVGGVSGGKEYLRYFKRDTMDILGCEKPIVLRVTLPYPTEEVSYREGRIRYSTLPDRECEATEDEYLTLPGGAQ